MSHAESLAFTPQAIALQLHLCNEADGLPIDYPWNPITDKPIPHEPWTSNLNRLWYTMAVNHEIHIANAAGIGNLGAINYCRAIWSLPPIQPDPESNI